eukprot:gene557-1969_t
MSRQSRPPRGRVTEVHATATAQPSTAPARVSRRFTER